MVVQGFKVIFTKQNFRATWRSRAALTLWVLEILLGTTKLWDNQKFHIYWKCLCAHHNPPTKHQQKKRKNLSINGHIIIHKCLEIFNHFWIKSNQRGKSSVKIRTIQTLFVSLPETTKTLINHTTRRTIQKSHLSNENILCFLKTCAKFLILRCKLFIVSTPVMWRNSNSLYNWIIEKHIILVIEKYIILRRCRDLCHMSYKQSCVSYALNYWKWAPRISVSLQNCVAI